VFGGEPITATSTQTGQLNLNFMVSALARVGYLVDPRNQIYGLAGWTFAGFNTTVVPFAAFTPLAQSFAFLSSSFGANGVTVGAGWEHQIADQWTWRTEYRYTRFQNVTLNAFTTNQSPAFNVDQAGRSTATVSSDLHVLRMGLTRYFDAGSPSAAGIFTEAPAAYATSWTGAYAGLSVGLGGENTRATTNFSSSSLQSSTAGPSIFMNSTNSFSVGNRQFGAGGVADVFIGYNRQMNDWVAGVQLEGTLARFNERLSRTLTQNTNGTSIIGGVTLVGLPQASSSSQFDTLSPNWMVTAAARLGRLVTPHDLIYGLAGWSFANFSTSLESAGDRTFNASGPTVGIGWERQLADQWTMRGEYRYTRFLDKTLSTPTSEAAADAGDTFTASSTSQTGISADSHIVRFGVSRAFGG
jgi:outer membrane immunogenic protein